jgi:hypothetical protein
MEEHDRLHRLTLEIHHRVMEIIQELILSQQLAHFDKVVQLLLLRCGMVQWQQLGIADYRSVPIVHVLFELSRKVSIELHRVCMLNSYLHID